MNDDKLVHSDQLPMQQKAPSRKRPPHGHLEEEEPGDALEPAYDEPTAEERRKKYWDEFFAATPEVTPHAPPSCAIISNTQPKVETAPIALPTPVSPAPSYGSSPPAQTCTNPFGAYLDRLGERRESYKAMGQVGVATGLPQLDEATGGLQGITILAGRTQSGKTSLAAQFCLAALQHDLQLAVVYFLLDAMKADELYDQIICSEAQVDHKNFIKPNRTKEDEKKIQVAVDHLQADLICRMTITDNFRDPLGAVPVGRHFTSIAASSRTRWARSGSWWSSTCLTTCLYPPSRTLGMKRAKPTRTCMIRAVGGESKSKS